ncbi:MAG: DNA helicase RecQ [Ruminococcus sp.]|nr:DNA helicase RecQ [Ruminococcus sp.]
MDKYEILKNYWGYDKFRGAQEKVIDNIISGKDVLCVMPTGAGKSICYQIPALSFSGVTIVVSPLISLMIDQVKSLVNMGINAAYLNSNLTPRQQSLAMTRAGNGAYKIIYVAPEKLLTSSFLELCKSIEISMVAIDEAHCISQWGQDFRPDYLKIVDFIEQLNARPVISAFTATATPQVKEDIQSVLKLDDPYSVTTGFDRPNLSFQVIHPKNKNARLLAIVKERKNECGIVYCNTRAAVDEVCELLCENDINAKPYHAGMDIEKRKQTQDDFIYDRCRVVVATNAFGMGIDKSDVSYVIHYNMPQNIEGYYQEAGRAGRDGNEALCVILYSGKDVATNKFLIEKSRENEEMDEALREIVIEHKLKQLGKMSAYCNTTECLRGFILRYFGQPHQEYCGNCSNCNGEFEEVDITVEAQKILSCVAKTNQHFGIKMIIDILRGSQNQKILEWNLDKQSTYGLLKSYSEANVKRIIDYLLVNEYAVRTQEKYPIIKLNEKSIKILKGEESVKMKIQKALPIKTIERQGTTKYEYKNHDFSEEMFEYLRSLRNELAEIEHVPSYIIFSNVALQDMCVKRPVTLSDFLGVSGVGENKLQHYGRIFTLAIGRYVEYEKGFYTNDELNLSAKELLQIPLSYNIDDRVLHKNFGEGTITDLCENNDEYLLKIKFDSGEEKMFYSSYCGVKKI